MSGRFIDRSAVERLSLGACACPGTPHEEDWIELRKELSGSEWARFAHGDVDHALLMIAANWNLVDADGDVVPRTLQTMADLDPVTFATIDAWSIKNLEYPELPNASGGRSRNGSKATASLTRTTPKKG